MNKELKLVEKHLINAKKALDRYCGTKSVDGCTYCILRESHLPIFGECYMRHLEFALDKILEVNKHGLG